MFDQISKFDFTETSNTVLDAVVDTNRRVVEAVVSAVDSLAERVTVDARITEALPALPTPAEAGARYLDFVEQAVAVNRDWNNRIVEMIRTDVPQAAATVTSTVTNTVTKQTAAAKKTVAKKSPAKKSPAKKRTAKKTAAKKTAARKTAAKKAASPSA
jgi:hypothetical protein